MLQGMRRNFESLERVHAAHKAAAAAFPSAGGSAAAKEMAPAAAEAAIAAESEAADHAQVQRRSLLLPLRAPSFSRTKPRKAWEENLLEDGSIDYIDN